MVAEVAEEDFWVELKMELKIYKEKHQENDEKIYKVYDDFLNALVVVLNTGKITHKMSFE